MLERAPSDIPWLLGSATAGRMAIILLGCVFALAIGPSLIMGSRPALRRKFTKAVWRYRYFLPATREERRWWLFLSLTAGVCEELLFRGYLLQYLSGRLEGGPALGLTGAWLVSSAAFGFGHLYQGARGVLGAALAGLALGLLAIMTGDLLLPILAHAVVDASALLAYRPQDDDPAQAGLLIRGCDLTREG
jgi:membrane protease YdiL (CAAX protease family)